LPRRLFGTDGVRGVAGELLTAGLALGLGRAAAAQSGARRVLVLRDTRESGPMLEAALAAGASAAGAEVLLAGVLPTPAAPLLVGRYGFDLAAVISASHNPYEDNGIKFFGGDGFKLSDATEAAIEARLGEPAGAARPERFGAIRALRGAEEDYLRALHERFAALDLGGRRVLLDCANGATYRVAPEVFRRLGANVTVVADAPDGRNINAGVGSTHVDALAERMRADPHDAAFAFDGDGDRVLAVDRSGAVVDGDELLALAATARDVPGVAVTVMTNYGFHTAMRAAGVEVATTKVGDRYVLEELRARGWPLGGEQSGHLIDMAFVPSGDGVAAALLTLEALGDTDLADRAGMEKLPQRLVNVRVADKEAAMGSATLRDALEREGAGLEGRGRVLVRPSGTEQLVRVMVEAPTDDEADAVCARLVAVVESG